MESPTMAVLLISHGSREAKANDEVREMADRLNRKLKEAVVVPCFLEIESPSIEEAFESAVARGALSVVAFPFFLSSGAHVTNDLPSILRNCADRHPQIQVSITPALGPDPGLDALAAERILSGGTRIDRAGSNDPTNS